MYKLIMLRLVLYSCLLLHVSSAFNIHKSNTIIPDRIRRNVNRFIIIKPTHLSHSNNNHQSIYSTTINNDNSNIQPSSSATTPSSVSEKFDGTAVLKYMIAITVQMGLFTVLFRSIDLVLQHYKIQKIPFIINFILFYCMALKSRIFNPMSNTRPRVKTLEANIETTTTSSSSSSSSSDDKTKKKDVATMFRRKMPSWTPPGIVFPIVWLLIIGPIRATASTMVYNTVGCYASIPILSLMLHLSIGDVWNTINNVERRFGVAVTGVFCVWLSKAHAAYQYSQINSVAGILLGVTLIWLSIATALVTATWRLNPDTITGKPEPLYPVTGKATTKFAWFSQKS